MPRPDREQQEPVWLTVHRVEMLVLDAQCYELTNKSLELAIESQALAASSRALIAESRSSCAEIQAFYDKGS